MQLATNMATIVKSGMQAGLAFQRAAVAPLQRQASQVTKSILPLKRAGHIGYDMRSYLLMITIDLSSQSTLPATPSSFAAQGVVDLLCVINKTIVVVSVVALSQGSHHPSVQACSHMCTRQGTASS